MQARVVVVSDSLQVDRGCLELLEKGIGLICLSIADGRMVYGILVVSNTHHGWSSDSANVLNDAGKPPSAGKSTDQEHNDTSDKASHRNPDRRDLHLKRNSKSASSNSDQ
uniref:H/ACA ribonucleoprotein complex subunit n=1 Tax=Panagrellus redivivus TaxID=6233 RepID=A0A7E5A266_PANRE